MSLSQTPGLFTFEHDCSLHTIVLDSIINTRIDGLQRQLHIETNTRMYEIIDEDDKAAFTEALRVHYANKHAEEGPTVRETPSGAYCVAHAMLLSNDDSALKKVWRRINEGVEEARVGNARPKANKFYETIQGYGWDSFTADVLQKRVNVLEAHIDKTEAQKLDSVSLIDLSISRPTAMPLMALYQEGRSLALDGVKRPSCETIGQLLQLAGWTEQMLTNMKVDAQQMNSTMTRLTAERDEARQLGDTVSRLQSELEHAKGLASEYQKATQVLQSESRERKARLDAVLSALVGDRDSLVRPAEGSNATEG